MGKKSNPPFKVGDLVTSDFYRDNAKLVRKITSVRRDESCGSGWRASADGGEICPHCGRSEKPIHAVDSPWFVPVKPGEVA
jgi:hypothetical protein